MWWRRHCLWNPSTLSTSALGQKRISPTLRTSDPFPLPLIADVDLPFTHPCPQPRMVRTRSSLAADTGATGQSFFGPPKTIALKADVDSLQQRHRLSSGLGVVPAKQPSLQLPPVVIHCHRLPPQTAHPTSLSLATPRPSRHRTDPMLLQARPPARTSSRSSSRLSELAARWQRLSRTPKTSSPPKIPSVSVQYSRLQTARTTNCSVTLQMPDGPATMKRSPGNSRKSTIVKLMTRCLAMTTTMVIRKMRTMRTSKASPSPIPRERARQLPGHDLEQLALQPISSLQPRMRRAQMPSNTNHPLKDKRKLRRLEAMCLLPKAKARCLRSKIPIPKMICRVSRSQPDLHSLVLVLTQLLQLPLHAGKNSPRTRDRKGEQAPPTQTTQTLMYSRPL